MYVYYGGILFVLWLLCYKIGFYDFYVVQYVVVEWKQIVVCFVKYVIWIVVLVFISIGENDEVGIVIGFDGRFEKLVNC